ncbi:MAG: hypothetical protein IRY84_14685 [Thermobispora bispora]|nr:hypothetical protein [Thermobispora bispora]
MPVFNDATFTPEQERDCDLGRAQHDEDGGAAALGARLHPAIGEPLPGEVMWITKSLCASLSLFWNVPGRVHSRK